MLWRFNKPKSSIKRALEQVGKEGEPEIIGTRRDLLKMVIQDAVPSALKAQAPRRLSLAELSTLPDELIGPMIPSVRPGVTLVEREGTLMASCEENPALIAICGAESLQATIIACFDGKSTIQEIAACLESEPAFLATDAFQEVRIVFEGLASQVLFIPLNP